MTEVNEVQENTDIMKTITIKLLYTNFEENKNFSFQCRKKNTLKECCRNHVFLY